jgi:hypothetical protein
MRWQQAREKAARLEGEMSAAEAAGGGVVWSRRVARELSGRQRQ